MVNGKTCWRATLSSKKKKNRFLQKIRRYLIYLIAMIFRRILLILPWPLSFRIGEKMGGMIYFLLPHEKKKALNNLSTAFGDKKSKGELRRIAREVFRNAGRSMAEILCWPRLGKKYLKNNVTIKHPERLLNAFEEGKGVIGLTAHFGNWEFMASSLANRLDIRFTVIARQISNPYLNEWIQENRKSMGIRYIYRGKGGSAILRCLKKNEGLGILADQNIRGEGVYVEFFGKRTKTLKSVADLIYRSKAKVVPLFMIRNKELTKHTLIVENPLDFVVSDNKEDDLKNIAQTYSNIIESYICRYPEQWMWMHSRWGRNKEAKR